MKKNIIRKIMTDRDLSIESKAIFIYFYSLMNPVSKIIESPTNDIVVKDLNISLNRLYVHRKPLLENGYLILNVAGGTGTTNQYRIGETLH